jgi:hypothetical protein
MYAIFIGQLNTHTIVNSQQGINMTDSITLKLDLSKLDVAHTAQIPVNVTHRDRPRERISKVPFDAWIQWRSPLTGGGVKLKVRTAEGFTPTAIVAQLNLPNATVGQNAELGHSVYAASVVGLALLKTFLADHSVPLHQLDLLGVNDLYLDKVTITTLVPVAGPRNVQEVISHIADRFEAFFPPPEMGKSEHFGMRTGSLGSLTAYCSQRGWEVRVYSTPSAKIPLTSLGGDVRAARLRFAQSVLRIELSLTFESLRTENLTRPTEWEHSHATGKYADLFDRYVRRKALRLDENLRTDKPDNADTAKLKPNVRHVVLGYLSGRLLEDCAQLKRDSKLATQKTISAMRIRILKALRIDTAIPWSIHRKIGNTWMAKMIVYPGDYHPPAHRAQDCFCKASSLRIQAALQEAMVKIAGEKDTKDEIDRDFAGLRTKLDQRHTETMLAAASRLAAMADLVD